MSKTKKCIKCGKRKPILAFMPIEIQKSLKFTCIDCMIQDSSIELNLENLLETNIKSEIMSTVATKPATSVLLNKVYQRGIMLGTDEKECPCCERVKLKSEFQSSSSTNDGYQSNCAECTNIKNNIVRIAKADGGDKKFTKKTVKRGEFFDIDKYCENKFGLHFASCRKFNIFELEAVPDNKRNKKQIKVLVSKDKVLELKKTRSLNQLIVNDIHVDTDDEETNENTNLNLNKMSNQKNGTVDTVRTKETIYAELQELQLRMIDLTGELKALDTTELSKKKISIDEFLDNNVDIKFTPSVAQSVFIGLNGHEPTTGTYNQKEVDEYDYDVVERLFKPFRQPENGEVVS